MCLYSIVKYLLFAFNFCFWLAGAAVLGVSIWVLVDDDFSDIVSVAGVDLYTGSYVLIAAGCVMLIVGFAGCCGAIKESTCLLGFYFACLLALFGVEVGIGIWAFVEYGSPEEAITDIMIDSYFGKITTDSEEFLTLQLNFKCCGLNVTCNGFESGRSTGCECKEEDKSDTSLCAMNTDAACQSGLIYNQPCIPEVVNFVDDNMKIIGGVALGIGLAELLGMMIAMCLCCKIKDKGHHA